jgi:spore coat polysaccharide biosynthesis protein SpsF (cytidylyltransferase family)
MNFEVFKGNVLISSVQFITGSLDYEHVTLAIRRMSAIKSSVIRLANYDDLRFTIDTPTDYFLLSFIFEVIRRTGLKGFELFDFLILTYPYLINSNSHVIQSKV